MADRESATTERPACRLRTSGSPSCRGGPSAVFHSCICHVIVMDDVQGVDIYLGQPFHHILVLVHHVVKIQILGGHRTVFRAYLLSADFIHTAVDGVEQALGQVGSGAKELHFLPMRILDTQQAMA